MDQLRTNLAQLGLTEEEIIVYMTVLEFGSETILHIAQKTTIPRTTVYLLIESLMGKGLLVEVPEGKKKKYIPASPEEIVTYAKSKQDKLVKTIDTLQKELPQLQALYNLKHEKPRVRYHEGVTQIAYLFTESLKSDEIYFHFMSEQGSELMEDHRGGYFDRILGKMSYTKQIISNTPLNADFAAHHSTARNQVICIDSKYQTSTDYMIYGDTVAFITYKDTIPMAIVIEDKEIAHFEKMKFNLLWNLLQQTEISSE